MMIAVHPKRTSSACCMLRKTHCNTVGAMLTSIRDPPRLSSPWESSYSIKPLAGRQICAGRGQV